MQIMVKFISNKNKSKITNNGKQITTGKRHDC